MSLAPLKPFNAPSLKRLFPFFSALRQKAFLRCASAIFLTLSELMRGKVTADAALGVAICGVAMWGGAGGNAWGITRYEIVLRPMVTRDTSLPSWGRR